MIHFYTPMPAVHVSCSIKHKWSYGLYVNVLCPKNTEEFHTSADVSVIF